MTSDAKSIEEDLTCGICHEILIEPVELECTHLFCDFCVSRWFEKHSDCPMCRAIVPKDPNDPDKLTAYMADVDRVIDRVLRSLPPVVQEQRRAAKRLREKAVEHETTVKRRKLDVESSATTRRRCVEAVMSIALVAIMSSLTWLY